LGEIRFTGEIDLAVKSIFGGLADGLNFTRRRSRRISPKSSDYDFTAPYGAISLFIDLYKVF